MGLTGSIKGLINHRLTEHCPYRFYFKDVTYHYGQGTLTLKGRLPSLYVKQVFANAITRH